MTFLFWISFIIFGLTLAWIFETILGVKQMTHIKDVHPSVPENPPRVSIIIPACNESQTIEPALQSVLALDYPDLEIIVINDRSTDETGKVLENMQKKHARIHLYEISKLPKGWLGKSHALQYGAERATGEYLLFTDADIVMENSIVKRAVSHMSINELDHLSMSFESITTSGLLSGLILDAYIGLLILLKPWKVKNKKSRKFMGAGAFNMVKADSYNAIGGHQSFSMHPIDDIMLGKVLKQKGFAQDCLLGKGFLKVKWYDTVRNFIDGVMKNTFAAHNFSILRVLAICLLIFAIGILPFWGMLLASGWTQLLFGATTACRIVSFAHGHYTFTRLSLINSLWALVTPYINIYIVLRAAIITLSNNGITWRDTHYSLDEITSSGDTTLNYLCYGRTLRQAHQPGTRSSTKKLVKSCPQHFADRHDILRK